MHSSSASSLATCTLLTAQNATQHQVKFINYRAASIHQKLYPFISYCQTLWIHCNERIFNYNQLEILMGDWTDTSSVSITSSVLYEFRVKLFDRSSSFFWTSSNEMALKGVEDGDWNGYVENKQIDDLHISNEIIWVENVKRMVD